MARVITVQEPRNYRLWYVKAFPLALISTTPLEVPYGTPDRERLAEDIAQNGLRNPLIVWNHTSTSRRPGPRPYYLKIGYNRLWALKSLCWTAAPALVAEKDQCPLAGAVELRSTAELAPYWGEGKFIWGVTGPTSKPVRRMEYYYQADEADRD